MNSLLRLGLALFLGFVSIAHAQPRDRDHGPGRRARVVLYSEADFHGSSIVLYPGDRIQDFATRSFDDGAAANDRISSVLIEGAVEFVGYSDSRYRGDSLRMTESASNLSNVPGPNHRGNWNDMISSATVVSLRGERRDRWPGGTGHGEVRGPRVELYSEAGYQGSRIVLTAGDRIRNLADVGFEDNSEANDRISSIKIVGNLSLTAYEDGDYRGSELQLNESVINLAYRQGRGGSRSWNDSISSIVVRRGDDHPMDRPAAETIVRRAYRDVLGRDPDPSGLATYCRMVREEGWTEEQVRNALKASEEYRKTHGHGR
ncbi:hypothetical protein DB347_21265 [Opitutaceae bacterium EW11]|nr:hypothetical protein DB347_21265 [Opitutaceae bacterium EW11]